MLWMLSYVVTPDIISMTYSTLDPILESVIPTVGDEETAEAMERDIVKLMLKVAFLHSERKITTEV